MDFLGNTWKERSKAEKKEHRILHNQIGLSSKFQFQHTILIFWNKLAIKKVSLKNKKSELHHWVLHICARLCIEFQLKLTIFIFLDQTCSKRMFPALNRCKEHRHWVLYIQINLGSNFPWTNKFEFLDQICPKRYCPRSEHPHWILHIRISLSTKFQPKLTILIFWTKFAQKG